VPRVPGGARASQGRLVTKPSARGRGWAARIAPFARRTRLI